MTAMAERIYNAQEWTELLKRMDARQLKGALRKSVRREAAKARKTALASLHSSSLKVRGNRNDLDKGLRTFLYTSRKALGFLVTVKARAANRNGKGEKGMHLNRFGLKKPVLMWAEEGTSDRTTKSKTKIYARKRKAHSTGRMPAYGFLEKSQEGMFRQVEEGLVGEIEKAVEEAARKSGMV